MNAVMLSEEHKQAAKTMLATPTPDYSALTTTAYVVGDVGYKLLRPRAHAIRTDWCALKMHIPRESIQRRHLNTALAILESDRIGLEAFVQTNRLDKSNWFEFLGFKAELTSAHIGPPPADADYAEVDWLLRRSSPDWCVTQFEAQVMGPERVRRCFAGAMTKHSDLHAVLEACEIEDGKSALLWPIMGAPLIPDRFLNENPDNWDFRARSKPALEARSLLFLAQYEHLAPPPRHWSIDEARTFATIVKDRREV